MPKTIATRQVQDLQDNIECIEGAIANQQAGNDTIRANALSNWHSV